MKDTIVDTLVNRYAKNLADNGDGGCSIMLKNDNREQLCSMYNIFAYDTKNLK